MKTPNLKYILETILEDKPQPMSKEERTAFLEELKSFSSLGEAVYGKANLEELVERVKSIVERGERIMTESGDWMSDVAHKKSFKRLQEDYRDFENTAREMKQCQERLSMAYENIGTGLSRYYDVN
jgi:hypothetical protein